MLDGQQRLTAMYYAFVAPDIPLPSRANRYLYYIRVDRFMDEAYDEAFDYDWTRTGENSRGLTRAVREAHLPAAVVGQGGVASPTGSGLRRVLARQRAAAGAGDERTPRRAGTPRMPRLSASTSKASPSSTRSHTSSSTSDLELDKVCDIFTQINSRGIRLDVFDLINALLKPKGLQLKHMWREAAPRFDFVDTERMNVYILQVMSILRQAYCSPKYLYYLLPGQEKSVREPDGSLRKEVLFRTSPTSRALGRGASMRCKARSTCSGIRRSSGRSRRSICPTFRFCRRSRRFRRGPSATRQPPARRPAEAPALVLGQRLHQPVFGLGRIHERARLPGPEGMVRGRRGGARADRRVSLAIPRLDLRRRSSAGLGLQRRIQSPRLRGARDWMTGGVPQYGDLDDHHIVPEVLGQGARLGTSIDTILNRTPLTADTNRTSSMTASRTSTSRN